VIQGQLPKVKVEKGFRVLDNPVSRAKITCIIVFRGKERHFLRVISGTLRGKKLFSAPGLGLRPTSDRVREAVFDILQGTFAGSRVLDLFAGTGAMGIEALSRGAAAAVFVENQKSPLTALRRNLAACRLEGVSEILAREAGAALEDLERRGRRFELIFLDPPYGKGLVRRTLEKLSGSPLLAPDARVVAEHDPAEEADGSFSLERTDFRRYGRTRISFFRPRPVFPGPEEGEAADPVPA
jgi:16S rRNA (guanine966-N2)-methyltransferase